MGSDAWAFAPHAPAGSLHNPLLDLEAQEGGRNPSVLPTHLSSSLRARSSGGLYRGDSYGSGLSYSSANSSPSYLGRKVGKPDRCALTCCMAAGLPPAVLHCKYLIMCSIRSPWAAGLLPTLLGWLARCQRSPSVRAAHRPVLQEGRGGGAGGGGSLGAGCHHGHRFHGHCWLWHR